MDADNRQPVLFYIPTMRLIVFVLFTLGWFYCYWVYKNWQYFKIRDKLDISPFWRGVFCIFHFYSLLQYIKNDQQISSIRQAQYASGWLTCGFVVTIILGNQFLIPHLFGFLFLLPVHTYITELNQLSSNKDNYTKWSFGQYVIFIPGFLLISTFILWALRTVSI